jgi:hypothetical protein
MVYARFGAIAGRIGAVDPTLHDEHFAATSGQMGYFDRLKVAG